ncbi:MAG: AAA family ATPase, partial [Bacteroidia bacterium]|nr:AAA family ATPase [Bacteroidia bacterium]
MIRVRFPYGISNIEKLILQGFVFVDKTEFIERLEVQGESYVSFLRPRKFGKSLWLSILEYYYDINQKHKFELLFGKYYIGKNPTPLHNSYRILFFDFSGIDTSDKEQAKQGFTLSVQASIDNFFDRYPDAYSIDKQNYVRSGVDAEEKMTLFFQRYDKRAPIYVLFDEYDHFTNDILYRSLDEFVDSVSKQGYIRKFYEVIKSAARQGIVDRVFITGVS